MADASALAEGAAVQSSNGLSVGFSRESDSGRAPEIERQAEAVGFTVALWNSGTP